MSSLRYWPTRRDSQGRIAVFFNSPFNADGVASKTFLRALRYFAFTAVFAQRRRRLWETAQKKGGRKPSFLWRWLDVKPPILAYPSGLVRTHCSVFQFTFQCGRCSEQNSFCERYVISLSLRSSPKGGADFGKRHKKKDGENRPFCGVDLMSSLRYWPTRRDSNPKQCRRRAWFYPIRLRVDSCVIIVAHTTSFCNRIQTLRFSFYKKFW